MHKRPMVGNWYMRMVDGKSTFEEDQKTHRGEYGFTPHIVELDEVVHQTVLYKAVCGMDGCGIKILRDTDDNKQLFNEKWLPIVKMEDGNYWELDENGNARIMKSGSPMFYVATIIQQPKLMHCSIFDWDAFMRTEFTGI